MKKRTRIILVLIMSTSCGTCLALSGVPRVVGYILAIPLSFMIVEATSE